MIDQVLPEYGTQFRDAGRQTERFRVMRYPDNYYRRSAGPGWALVGDIPAAERLFPTES
ncbi:hypothetical protein ACFWF7_03905 [Nocardia sp. NPDC060256]|uniref:hypothetical protein n=1 Tax=unclassified Nocardia TaxID=2637762 RepID=UPI00365D2266